MRASTLFGLTIAILIGMAVVFGVKSAGLFSGKVPVVAPPDRPKVLVAKSGLFEGLTAMSNDVMVRPVDDAEMDHYMRNKHKYMPAFVEAANFRVLARNVYANEPLLKEHFKDLGLPGSFDEILEPGMQAVNLQVRREHAGGGVIRKGDRVDVLLTTNINAAGRSWTATAPIALGLKVIIKRDSIFTRMEPIDDSKPLAFTLQANRYRAALIEHAKNRGTIILVPTGPSASKKVGVAMTNEGKDEEQRIIRLSEHPITDRDLEEIFKVGPIPASAGIIAIERWKDITPAGGHFFHNRDGAPPVDLNPFAPPSGTRGYGYQFQQPSASNLPPGYVPCATCPGGMKKAG